MAVSALVALGVAPGLASAAPVEFITPVGGTREEKAYPIPAADGTQIDKGNDAIITRWQGKVYAYALACPHQNTALKWYGQGSRIRVPQTPLAIHARRHLHQGQRAARRAGLDRFAVRKDGNNIVVNLDKVFQEDENEAQWKAAFVTV